MNILRYIISIFKFSHKEDSSNVDYLETIFKLTEIYEQTKNKKWDLTDEGFAIDENLNFTYSPWNGIWIKGGDTIIETIELINRFIEEGNKNESRDFSWIKLVA